MSTPPVVLRVLLSVLAFRLAISTAAAAPDGGAVPPARKVVQVGTRPESVTRGWGGRYFITVMNGDVGGDGVVKVLEGETVRDFATGMDEPKGICFTGKQLIVADAKQLWRIDRDGTPSVLVDEEDFPHPPGSLNDIACEPGNKAVYVSDMGANTKMRDPAKKLWPLDSPQAKALPAIGRVYRVGLDYKVSIAVDSRPEMTNPNGVTAPARGRLLVAEFFTGTVFRVAGGRLEPVVTGLRGADGIEEDAQGNIYVSSWEQGKVWRLPRPADKGVEPTVILEGLQSAADFYLDRARKVLLVPDTKAGTLTFVPLDR